MATCPTCRARYADDAITCPADGEALLPDQAFSAADVDLQPGDVVGEYEITGPLGKGGFGSVFRARHPLIGKEAAVKVLHRQYCSNPQVVSRFIAEARSVNQIRHRNIIDIFSFGALADGRQFFVMELLEGTTFDRFIKEHGGLEPEVALPILHQVARALDAAHAAGITHRDLKPENVFLAFDDEGHPFPKVLDFGIAKLKGEGIGHKTRTGAPMGTPNYMSPEQCRGVNVDHRTDVYAFGVMTFEALTGRVPFVHEQVMDVLMAHIGSAPPEPSSVSPALDPSLDAPILAMLEKHPDDRPSSLTEAIDAVVVAARAAGHDVPIVQRRAFTVRGASTASLGAPKSLSGPDAATQLDLAAAEAGAAGGRSTRATKGALTSGAAARATSAAASGSGVSSSGGAVASSAPGTSGPLEAASSAEPKQATMLEATSDVVPAPGKRVWMVAALALALGAGAGVLLLRGKPAGEGASPAVGVVGPSGGASASASASGAAGPIVAPAGSASGDPAPQKSANVRLTVTTEAKAAEVFSGAKRLGPAGQAIELPRSDVAVVLQVRAPGFKPKELKVVPDGDKELAVELAKAPTAGGIDKDLTY
jgi:serine/threonine protein kinase